MRVRASGAGWGTVQVVPGISALSAGSGGQAGVDSVSCASAGNCSAGGSYTDGSGLVQAFVVSEISGTWEQAEEVPGTAILNKGGYGFGEHASASISSVSCVSAGNCSAGGSYTDGSGQQVFVVSETSGRWHKAEEVPGTAALNKGGDAAAGEQAIALISSVSCVSAGNCSAGGAYTDGSGHKQAFVVSESSGTWRQAEEVPGSAALNAGRNVGAGGAEVSSVACASAGNCSAGGFYTEGSGESQAFVVSEISGRWQQAEEVPGSATFNKGGPGRAGAGIDSVSCASAGNCSAGGYYTDGSGESQAFVVSEISGRWQQAEEVPGTGKGYGGSGASIESVSCTSAGNCSAGGSYADGSGASQAFVVSEISGRWRQAEEVPGTAALNAGRVPSGAEVSSVSCASAGNCSAGGFYTDGSGHHQVFVVSETSGVWQQAEEMPGTATLTNGGAPRITSVSCASAGNCSAGGYYTDGSGHQQAFVVSET